MATVSTIVDDSTNYADGWIEDSQALIDKMGEFAFKELDIPYIHGAGFNGVIFAQELQEKLEDKDEKFTRPEFNIPEGDAITPPEVPVIGEFTLPSEVSIDNFTEEPEEMNVGVAPTLEFPEKGYGAAPGFNPPVIGAGPDISLSSFGPLPDLDAIVIPQAPNLSTIEFASVAPDGSTLAPPSDIFSFNEQDYSSELLSLLQLKLKADLTNGGYGIEVTDEIALWERAREREVANATQAMDEIDRAYTSRRFSSPPGGLFAALEKAQQTLQDASATFSREVALKRADLYVQNRQFTIQQGSQLETILINFYGARMERQLNTSKYLIDSAIAAYNAKVTAYNAKLDGYKTDAQIFETKLRANSLLLEQYKTTADVEKIRADVNMSRIEQYKAGIDAHNTLVNLYKVQVEAAQVKASVERLNLDAFRAQVDAYTAEVHAKEAEFNAFDAKVRGELGKAQIFEAKVRSYTGKVDAVKAKTEAESLILKAEVEKARAELDKYSAQISEYKITLESLIQVEGLKERIYGADVNAYNATITSRRSMGDMRLAEFTANTESYFSTMNYNLEKAKTELERASKESNMNFGAAKSSVDMYTAMITASLNSINALAVQTATE